MQDPFMKHLVIAAGIVLASAIAGILLKRILRILFEKFFRKTETTLDDRIYGVLQDKVIPLIIILGIGIAIREVTKGLAPDQLTHFQVLEYLSLLLFFVLSLILAHMVSRLLKATIEWYGDSVSREKNTDVTTAITPIATKIINVLLFLIVSLIVLDRVGVNIGGLLVSFGVGTLAVALAAQETIANMIGWFVIVIDQPFRIGDTIKLPTGEEGRVFQIGLRATRILNPDHNLIIIPNGEIAKTRITNISTPSSVTRLVIDINVAYGTDIEVARKIVLELTKGFDDILTSPPVEVVVMGFHDGGIQLRLEGQVVVANKFFVETRLREQIYNRFQKQNIGFAVPRRFFTTEQTNATQAAQAK